MANRVAPPVHLDIVSLKVDYVERPLGIDNSSPTFSWRLESKQRGVVQTSYRILVASSPALLDIGVGDLWDSGAIESSCSLSVEYEGPPLISRERYWWKIHVSAIHSGGTHAAWSEPSWWEMGLLSEEDWTAQWLVAEPADITEDRRTPVSWVFHGDCAAEAPVAFRYGFTLPEPSQSSHMFIAFHDRARLAGAWLDEQPIEVSGPSQWIDFGPVEEGKHILALEIEIVTPVGFEAVSHEDGIYIFVRHGLQSGKVIRDGTGPHWKSSCGVADPDWHSLQFDDATWPQSISLGLEGHEPWPAQPALYFRYQFVLDRPVARARLYYTSLGSVEARVNGLPATDVRYLPERSQYEKRLYYQADDVTDFLRLGENTLGAVIADGHYASARGRFIWGPPPRRMIAQLEIIFTDGSCRRIETGKGWRCSEGPIRSSEVGTGEVHDNRLALSGWDLAGFDDTRWLPAVAAERAPALRLTANICPPIRSVETVAPISVIKRDDRTHFVDFGKSLAGYVRIKLRGASGSTVSVFYSDALDPDGALVQDPTCIGEKKHDTWILAGADRGETFEARFTYTGLRYALIASREDGVQLLEVEAVRVGSDLEPTSALATAPAAVQSLHELVLQTQKSNFVGVATDNPTREQQGWTGDAGLFWDTATYNMDLAAFTRKVMTHITDDQKAGGAFPKLAPYPHYYNLGPTFDLPGSAPGWGDAGIIIPWEAWRKYGDVALLHRHWAAMWRYLAFIRLNNPNYLWLCKRDYDFGDWLAVDQNAFERNDTTSRDLIATAYWAHSTRLLAEIAIVIGKPDEAEFLNGERDRIVAAFHRAFVRADGTIGNGSQASYILPLAFDLIAPSLREMAGGHLVADIVARDTALSTGILGTAYALDVLADLGRTDIAVSLLLKRDYPSWGYMLENGATAVWETWDGNVRFGSTQYRASQNQFALGAFGGFLFRRLAGIDSLQAGFSQFRVAPHVDARIDNIEAHYHSVLGTISSRWNRRQDGSVDVHITVPPNTRAHFSPIGLSAAFDSHSAGKGDFDEAWHPTVVPLLTSGDHHFILRPETTS